jgi:hypothetical protein
MRCITCMATGGFTKYRVCSAMGIESALTQVFIKWKSIEHLGSHGSFGTEAERDDWENEYRQGTRPGGFMKSSSFVAKSLWEGASMHSSTVCLRSSRLSRLAQGLRRMRAN